ncbi:flagellar biosynthesis protein FlhB [Terricaulis silvestris]|uniref:Flagellar biosynthetic protein FlhB n=1 Tax=Terricaulis silvestris TaxID=2686094 RepID=A0A6I6MSV1_9CAUL|nr:flagellar biosynthesis protein FlhB [Terricaulis silvestris]QGZ95654.1 Flagellar biosynthetic protein FlhB [Terricaulis silvestris]
MAADDDEKTEEPTPRKLEQAREKGDIIYTPEVGTALSLIAVTAIVAFMSGPIVSQMAHGFIGFIAMPDQFSSDPGSLKAVMFSIVLKLMAIFGLTALALAGASVAARYIQAPPTFTGEKLTPKLEKLNPFEGFKRVFGKAAFATFLKSLAKLVLVGAVLVSVLWPHKEELQNISLLDPPALLPFIKDRVVDMLIAMASAAALLAAVDYVFTRQSYMQRQKMSRREIKEELRQQDGDPMVKAKLRAIRIQRSRQRMLQNVPQASVVITNPTHYAIALKYEPGETPAPICLAMGVDAVAARIREVAEEHNIPLVEDPPLARALFATAEIDRPIPKEHYEAVAKVIGFVMRLARRRGRRRTGL